MALDHITGNNDKYQPQSPMLWPDVAYVSWGDLQKIAHGSLSHIKHNVVVLL